jgi:hypothetical protein
MIPSPKAPFRPRAEAGLLSRLIQEAWRSYHDSCYVEAERRLVAETVASHLERLLPAADLEVLRRYGFAEETSHVCVRIYDGKDWSHSTGVDLPRKVWTTRNLTSLSCCGAWYSEDPNFGLNAEYRRTMSAAEWERHVAFTIECDRIRLPKSVEPYFARIVEGKKAYVAEYRRSATFPKSFRDERGRWPTWGEIEINLPVLGRHIASLRERKEAA